MKNNSKLYRAHSMKYLQGGVGVSYNQNYLRSRQPRDMPIEIHKILGAWFVDRFGIDYRTHSLFCTGDASVASGYVDSSKRLVTIEPIGEYSVCYSPKCKDLFGYYQFYWSVPEKRTVEIVADLDSLDFVQYRNSGIDLASNSGNEVMLATESFRYNVVG